MSWMKYETVSATTATRTRPARSRLQSRRGFDACTNSCCGGAGGLLGSTAAAGGVGGCGSVGGERLAAFVPVVAGNGLAVSTVGIHSSKRLSRSWRQGDHAENVR